MNTEIASSIIEHAKLTSKLNKSINKLCYPILLPYEIMEVIDDIITISIFAHGNILCTVDIKKYPQSIHNNLFFPFYSDKYFNLYIVDAKYSEIYIEAKTIKNKVIKCIFERDHKNIIPSEKSHFHLKTHEGEFKYLASSGGVLGFITYHD